MLLRYAVTGATRGGPPAWELGEMLTTPRREYLTMLRIKHKSLGAGFCECSNESVFHKMRGLSQLAKELLASQEGLCSMELVS